jgi:hypothetical protein
MRFSAFYLPAFIWREWLKSHITSVSASGSWTQKWAWVFQHKKHMYVVSPQLQLSINEILNIWQLQTLFMTGQYQVNVHFMKCG